MSFISDASRISKRISRIEWPRSSVAQIVLLVSLLTLVGTAVIIARGEVATEVAAVSRQARAADGVTAAAVVLGNEVSEAVLISQLVDADLMVPERRADSISRVRETEDALLARVAALAGTAPAGAVETLGAVIQGHVQELANELAAGATADAIAEAENGLGPALEEIVSASESISAGAARRITALGEGIGTVTTAARYVSALFIPLSALFVLYRGMRRAQRTALLRNDLAREQELRIKKDAFVAAASHHINTPLAAVVGFAELLRDRTRDFNAGVRSEVIELLALQAQETAWVVDNLLVAARTDLGGLELDQRPLELRDVVDTATADWETTQRLRLTINGNAATVGDYRWLSHAVRNVLRNAASFGCASIHVDIGSIGRMALIKISDDGAAVPESEADKMFLFYNAYQQVKGLAPSLGLGLSVSRHIARMMGGDLTYHHLDGWNVFSLSIPSSGTANLQLPTPPARTLDPMRGKPTLDAITSVIASGGPHIEFQPIVSLRRDYDTIVGYEALARFDQGSPPEWFGAAATLGWGLELELAAIRSAIDGFRDESQAFLAVNLADRTLHSSRLFELIDSVDPGRLVLELSEAATIKSYEATTKVVDALAERGVRLAVDDIGAGEVDLWHMTRIGAHFIKIDMSLVHEMTTSPRERGLVKGIVALAAEIGASVIAEGVETEEQHQMLIDLGVEFGQGYLYGLPGPLNGGSKRAVAS